LVYVTLYDSPIGLLEISSDEEAILSILFIEKKKDGFTENDQLPVIIKNCIAQLKEYFDGNRKVFEVNYKLHGTIFQNKVWALLEEIPFGKIITYKQQALRLGNLKAIRAVGTCNGKNPISIIIPCHRVLGSNGDLTGYAGGLHNKKWLLEHEQKHTANVAIQQNIFEFNE
jgi:methylated-DNA-[protein]-cysteine S-methyltransferase